MFALSTLMGLVGVIALKRVRSERDPIRERASRAMDPAADPKVYAEITVADELSAAQKKSLEKSLSSFVEKGSKVSVEYKVDPSILGGLVVDVGDKHINMSILARVQQLQNLINQPI